MVTQYMVVGFCFNSDKSEIALIRKNHPDWQKNKLNGIGGKMDDVEMHYEAMLREFKEEAGVDTKVTDWKMFARLAGNDFYLFCYACFDNDIYKAVHSCEEEQIERWNVADLLANPDQMISNLPWLINMCLDSDFARMVSDVNYDGFQE